MKLLSRDNYAEKREYVNKIEILKSLAYSNQWQLKCCSILVQSLRIYNFGGLRNLRNRPKLFCNFIGSPCFGNRYAINGVEINK